MERVLILLVAAALTVYVAPGVQGTFHLSFSNNTQVNISRDGCGDSKTCVETPTNCDPMMNSSCLFTSIDPSNPMPPDGVTFSTELSGKSMGYIAMGLTQNASMGTSMLFICAQDSNGTFFFRTMERNNSENTLRPIERIVGEIRGSVNGTTIMCEFDIPSVNASNTRASSDTTFSVLLGSGMVNGDTIGDFNLTLTRDSLDLSNPASTATTAAPGNSSDTTMAMTTESSGSNVHPHALLLLLSVLSLAFLLRA